MPPCSQSGAKDHSTCQGLVPIMPAFSQLQIMLSPRLAFIWAFSVFLVFWWMHNRREAELHRAVLFWYIRQLVTLLPLSKIIPGLRIAPELLTQQLKPCQQLQVWFKPLLVIYSFLVLYPLVIPARPIFFVCLFAICKRELNRVGLERSFPVEGGEKNGAPRLS